MVLPAAGLVDRGLRPHDYDQRRRGGLGDHRLPARARVASDPARRGPPHPGSRRYLVRPWGALGVRRDDGGLHRRGARGARTGFHLAGCIWLGAPHAPRRSGTRRARRAARLPGCDGTRDRHRGALFGDRPTRPARRCRQTPLRSDHTVADACGRGDADGGPVSSRRQAAGRDPAPELDPDRRSSSCGSGKRSALRRLPGNDRGPAARRRELILPGGTGPAQSPVSGRRRRRRLAGLAWSREPAPHALRGGVIFLAISAAIVATVGGDEQRLVLFYAVAVFGAFLCGLLAMARFFRAERRWALLTA